MKTITISLLSILLIISLVGCNTGATTTSRANDTTDIRYNMASFYPITVVYDSCEYVYQKSYYSEIFAHKGNCKFCKQRNSKN